MLIALPITVLADTDRPSKLALLNEAYEAAKERAIKPITTKYIDSLVKLKRELTTAARLKEALKVDQEMERVIEAIMSKERQVEARELPDKALDLSFRGEEELISLLTSRAWTEMSPRGSHDIQFHVGGKVTSIKKGWTWKLKGADKIVLTYRDGNGVTYDFGKIMGNIVLGNERSSNSLRFLAPRPGA